MKRLVEENRTEFSLENDAGRIRRVAFDLGSGRVQLVLERTRRSSRARIDWTVRLSRITVSSGRLIYVSENFTSDPELGSGWLVRSGPVLTPDLGRLSLLFYLVPLNKFALAACLRLVALNHLAFQENLHALRRGVLQLSFHSEDEFAADPYSNYGPLFLVVHLLIVHLGCSILTLGFRKHQQSILRFRALAQHLLLQSHQLYSGISVVRNVQACGLFSTGNLQHSLIFVVALFFSQFFSQPVLGEP